MSNTDTTVKRKRTTLSKGNKSSLALTSNVKTKTKVALDEQILKEINCRCPNNCLKNAYIVVCLTFGHHQISHTHTHKILFLVKLKRNKFQKLVIIILIIFIYISTITVIYQCNSSTFFFYLRF